MGNLKKAAATNNRRDTLIALRDTLADSIDGCESGRDMAALSKRMMEVIEEIDKIPDPESSKSAIRKMQKKVNGGS